MIHLHTLKNNPELFTENLQQMTEQQKQISYAVLYFKGTGALYNIGNKNVNRLSVNSTLVYFL